MNIQNIQEKGLEISLEKEIVKKEKKDFKISLSKIDWPFVTNALVLMFCLTNPYFVGFSLRWGVEQFQKGWQEQPECFEGSPRVVGISKDIPLHLKTTCAPSGE